MGIQNVKTLIRIECSSILDTQGVVAQLRSIDGFLDMMGTYTTFPFGNTSNYKAGNTDLPASETVHRYVKKTKDLEIRLDLTSKFYYISLSGNSVPSDIKPYVQILEKVTAIIMDRDDFVHIISHAIRKDFVETKVKPSEKEMDDSKRLSYKSEISQVYIMYIEHELQDHIDKAIVAIKTDEQSRPRYDQGERLYDKAFFNTLIEAEKKYELF